jgi:NTP pyrophosphatase (non-canonical NTP hydrolase)
MSDLTLGPNPTLKEFQAYVAQAMQERSFDTKNIPKRFMMLMEESGEFAKAARKAAGMKFADDTAHAKLDEEAADVFIILLGLCNMLDVDLEKAFRAKEEHNKTRTWK